MAFSDATDSPAVPPLVEQLALGGRLVIPVGSYRQELMLLEKRADGSIDHTSVIPVQFVPMTRAAEPRGNLE